MIRIFDKKYSLKKFYLSNGNVIQLYIDYINTIYFKACKAIVGTNLQEGFKTISYIFIKQLNPQNPSLKYSLTLK